MNAQSTITHKRILNIAVPMVLANATVPILGAVDTGVVGQLGDAASIGAVGIGAIIITAIYWIFGFLRMGTVGLTAQALGAEDRNEVSALLVRAAGFGFVAGLVLILLQIPLFAGAFWIAPASEGVEGLAQSYLQIRVWSAPAAIALYGITGWLIAKERTRAVLVLQLWMNGINIILDLFFVLGLDWGVEGVAIATFIAEWSGLGLGLFFAKEALRPKILRNRGLLFAKDRVARMAMVNSDIMIRSVLLEAGFVSFLFYGSSFDDVTLAANQVLLQFLHITAYAMDGFAFAAESLVGQAMGAKRRGLLRQAAKRTSIWGVAIVIVLAAIFAIIGPALIDLMAKSEPVQQEARDYLFWMVLAPLMGCAAWMLDGIFIGATRTRDMRNMMVISFAVYVAALMVLAPRFENHGLWAAMMIFFVVRGVTLALRYPALERAVD